MKQTIKLVEGLASTAATAAPQYAPIAGAAAATVAAFISQNRDKVEFEHTFVFSPDGFAEDGISSTPHASQATLREGKLVVLKGKVDSGRFLTQIGTTICGRLTGSD